MREGHLLSRALTGLIFLTILGQSACHVPVARDTAVSAVATSHGRSSTTTSTSSSFDPASPRLPVFMVEIGGRPITKGREILGALRVIETHDGTLQHLAAQPVALQTTASIEVHGETSATMRKRSYRLELVDARGKDHAQPLLDLPAGSDWVLHGCSADRTCLRNALAYSLANAFGRYAPRTRFIELFIDHHYEGIYVLVERVRRDRMRVDLPKPADTPAAGDISGGYIFKMDLGEGSQDDVVRRDWVSGVFGTLYSYYYPRFNQISDAQKTYLHDYVDRFEEMMQGEEWDDPRAGYRQWLDVPSWVDFALIQELSLNPDAYFKSIYLQKWPKRRGDRLAIGPVWDFDVAFGQAEFRDARNVEAWAYTMNRFGGEPVRYDPPGRQPYVPEFWQKLWSDPAFQHDVRCRWDELRKGPLTWPRISARIDGWATQLATSAQPRDGALWGHPPPNAFAGEVDTLKSFLSKRLQWMDANLPGACRLNPASRSVNQS